MVVTVNPSNTPYAGAAGMFLHINVSFTMGKRKSSHLSQGFVLNLNFEVYVKVLSRPGCICGIESSME